MPDNSNSRVTVRLAGRSDTPALLSLILALAEYEKLDPPTRDAQQRLVEDAFGPHPKIQVWLAELADGSAIGYAIFVETYSSFLGLPTLFIEDIFVRMEHRGVGAGYSLFREAVAEARRRGCGRVDWMVLDWNQSARAFYARQGGTHLAEWCPYRLSHEQFDSVLSPPSDRQ